MLNNIRMVLVETTHPGNIGGAARAMKNMCLQHLHLVNPRQFPHAEATARASGADDLLADAVVHGSLDEALADCGLVFGASARQRRISWPHVEPRQVVEVMRAKAGSAPVAFVFGREHSGLTNEELERCHYLVGIPSNPEFSSLNVAAAVQIIAYEVMIGQETRIAGLEAAAEEHWVGGEAMELFFAHLEQALVTIGFLDPRNPRMLMRRLRRLFNRSRLDERELNILRGILTAAERIGR